MSMNQWEIPFRNDSGETIPPFGIIRVSGCVVIGDRPVVTALKPNTYGSQYAHIVNSPVQVKAGKFGSATGIFPCLALYDTADGTPAVGDRWGPRDATWKLKKHTGGFGIIGLNGTTGLVIVTREPMLCFHARFNSTTSKGSTGTVSIYRWSGATKTDTGVDMANVLNVAQDVTSSDNVYCTYVDNQWEACLAECD